MLFQPETWCFAARSRPVEESLLVDPIQLTGILKYLPVPGNSIAINGLVNPLP